MDSLRLQYPDQADRGQGQPASPEPENNNRKLIGVFSFFCLRQNSCAFAAVAGRGSAVEEPPRRYGEFLAIAAMG